MCTSVTTHTRPTAGAWGARWECPFCLPPPGKIGYRLFMTNMRRGLLRFWVLGTACWIVAGVYLHQNDLLVIIGYTKFPDWEFTTLANCWERDSTGSRWVDAWSSWFRPECYAAHRRAYWGLVWVLMPPVAVLILGSSIGWVLSGFRGKQP
jgi:hypothetical protein